MPGSFTIGRLAKAAGVNVETIRYYQRRGLIGEPRRPPGGHRTYAPEALERIGFIRRAQQLGFSLAEVKDLLQLSDGKSTRKVRAIAERKVEFLGRQIAEMGRMRRKLAGLVAASKRCEPRGFCPIIAELTRAAARAGRKKPAA